MANAEGARSVGTHYEGAEGYFVLDNPEMRRNMYELCKAFCEYLKEKEVANVIFLDRGARAAWVGVDEYWKTNYPDQDRPGFFFLNPNIFDDVEKAIVASGIQKGNLPGMMNMVLSGAVDRVGVDFQRLFKGLIEEKDKPLVVFDTCSHTGETIAPIVKFLERFDFSDVQVVTADKAHATSAVQPDFVLSGPEGIGYCNPFGPEGISLVQKGSKVITHRAPQNELYDYGVAMRKEIRQVIRDKGEK